MLRFALAALALPSLATAQTLVAHYQLNETSGTLVSDSSGNGLDGQLLGTTSWAAGQLAGGLDLDGFGGRMVAPGDPLHDVSELTLAAWVNVDVLGDWDGVITKGMNTSPYALQLGFPIGKFKFTANWGTPPGAVGGGSYTSIAVLTPDTWHHLAVTFDGTDVKLYLDGALDSIFNVPGMVLGTNAEELTLGADFPGGDEFFDGTLDDVRLYDGALSDAEIALLANIDVGTTYCSPAVANSTGLPATIAGLGNADQANGVYSLSLRATNVPPNQFGYFVGGQVQGFVVGPGGSQGNLCLSIPLARFVSGLQSSGAAGELGFAVDLDNIPLTPVVAVQAGESWSFQAWFRDDNPGPTSNFSDGLVVQFL